MNKFKNFFIIIVALFISNTSLAQLNVKNSLDSLSYAIGVNIGQNLKQQGLTPNTDLLASAIKDILAGNALYMDANECNGYIQSYFQNIYTKKAEENRKIGEEFLASNKTKEGVKSLPSGLQYRIIKAATSSNAKPTATSKVKVNYEGRTIDGQIFDSSIKRGTPAEFGCNQVIRGWTEILQLMSPGDNWEVYIPSDLAYGTQGSQAIGPNQVLIFTIELLDIVSQ